MATTGDSPASASASASVAVAVEPSPSPSPSPSPLKAAEDASAAQAQLKREQTKQRIRAEIVQAQKEAEAQKDMLKQVKEASGSVADSPPNDDILEDMFPTKKARNPLVPLGAFVTAGVLLGGLWSFKTGRVELAQQMMRARVVAQGATVAVMTASAAGYSLGMGDVGGQGGQGDGPNLMATVKRIMGKMYPG